MILRNQFIHSVLFTAGAKYIGLVVQLVITGILSRLLTPKDFGVIAIATVFIVFFNLLCDIGIGVAVIQNKTLTPTETASIFSFSVYLGVLLGLLFFLASGFIADYYSQPMLIAICRLLSLTVLFASLNVVPNALLLKEKKFRFIAQRTLLIQVASGIVGIAAAYAGLKAYALILYAISASVFMFIFNYLKNPLSFELFPKLSAIRKIFRYSIYQFLFNFINYFSRNLDKLLIGKFLSPASLGLYDKAYRLMLLPVENLTYVLSAVIHPHFSEFQQDKRRIFDIYMKIVQVLALVGFPLSIFLHFTASELIFIIFGRQWSAAIPPFEVLAWSVGLQIVLSSSGSIFQAANNTKLLFVSGFLSAITMILGILYGIFISKSLIGVSFGLLAAFLLNFVQCYILLIRMLNGDFITFIKLFRTPLILASLVFISESLLNNSVTLHNEVASFLLKSAVAVAAVTSGMLLLGEHRQFLKLLRSLKQQ
ncbi:lipopolysaccharide biosynthesis protein [Chitinophaga barathri]|uniref:Lipopolysaccharide biosynthesis protein n=1 Tax=Chitinophaga barathri TaxID=1647451 RepID=A0A3N4MAU0_9BACT|nr:lipopolysaccharide biosynthesis protein [Chitinophaga barathri]RPD40495.1 lipopolysaccharide biosynthesis protein [Chitinophaga barathri]